MVATSRLLLCFAMATALAAIQSASVATKSSGQIMQSRTRPVASMPTTQLCEEAYASPTTSSTAVVAASINAPKPVANLLMMTALFLMWYAFNAGYNVFNSYMKADFPFPWTTAVTQLVIGLGYSIPLWFINVRKMPVLLFDDFLKLLPIAILNAGSTN